MSTPAAHVGSVAMLLRDRLEEFDRKARMW